MTSTAPFPDPADLDRLLEKTTKFRLTELDGGRDLLEVQDPSEVAALRKHLRILVPDERFHCMCLGDQTIEVYGADGLLGELTLHHGERIRWDRWNSDADLVDPMGLREWLAARGVEEPLREWERDQEEQQEAERAWESWLRAAPQCLVPLLNPDWGRTEDLDLDQAMETLRAAYGEDADAVVALLEWYGQGEGPWSSYPSYEEAAGQLLLRFPSELIVRGLTASPPTRHQLEGAARYFSQSKDVSVVPDALAGLLLQHMGTSEDQGNRRRLEEVLRRHSGG